MNKLAFLSIISILFSTTIFAQKRDSMVYPDTAYLMDNIYRIDNGKVTSWGFYKEGSKEWLTPPQYDSLIHRFRAGINLEYYEIREKGKWGLLKPDRSAWVPAVYDKLDYEHAMEPQRIFVKKGDKYGILNKDGSSWLAPVYEEILFNGSNFKVKKDGKWGILNSEGKEFIPLCYDKIFEHSLPEMSLVQNGTEYWSIFLWVQKTANLCKPEEHFLYERIEYFNEFFTVFKNGKWGLVDRQGEFILKMEYEELKPFVFSYLRTLRIKQNGKYGLLRLDSLGKTQPMAETIYDDIGIDEDSYKIRVSLNGKRDYLYDGKPYFDLVYEDVFYFLSYRMFSIKKGKKWGLARENKEVFIQPKYEKIMFIDEKTYMVQKGGKWGVINDRDEVLIPIDFSEFDYRPEAGYFFATKGGKWGVVSLKQGVVLPAKYDDLVILPNRTFLVELKGLVGVVGPGGKVIVPIEYSQMNYKPGDAIVLLTHADGRKFKYRIK